MKAVDARPAINFELLRGFEFACRPDCGLCCFAEPRIETLEREKLLRIVPEAEVLARGSGQFLAARPEGGACQFLERSRCKVHEARPHPCREFPLTVHLGTRLQVTVVLSCPGVDLSPLASFRAVGDGSPPRGFDAEVAALTERLGPDALRRQEEALRRRRKIARRMSSEHRWQEEEEVRAELRDRDLLPRDEDFPADDPPEAREGLEHLPLFFDPRARPGALARALGGWEVLELAATGGARSLGVFLPPERLPSMDEEAARLLRGYLRYWLERDLLLAAVHVGMLHGSEGDVVTGALGELRAVGATVLARAVVRAKLTRGSVSRLTSDEVRDGIRATDQDLLDRPTWGDRF